MPFCLNDKKCLVLDRYLYIVYIIFICAFFVFPVRAHRNFYYVGVFFPFLVLVLQKKIAFLFRSNVFLITVVYLFFMCLTFFWSDGVECKESFNYVRRSFLTLSFVCVTAYLFKKNRNFFQTLFIWSCCVSGVMAFFWILLFYFVEGNVGRIGSLGGRNAPIQAGNIYAFMAVVTCLFFSFRSRVLTFKFLLYCCIALSLLSFVVLTGSRGSILSLLATILFCSILLDIRKTLFASCCLIFLVGASLVFDVLDFSRFFVRGSSFRWTIWKQSIDALAEKPFLGYGYRGVRPNIIYSDNIIAEHSHNVFLSNALDGGLVSILMIIALLLLSGYWTFRQFKNHHDVIPCALVLFAVLSNLTDGRTLVMSPGYQWLCFWFPVSIAVALELTHKGYNADRMILPKFTQ